jgi:acetyl-CoA carboxylase biotin carboxyl carrier protein
MDLNYLKKLIKILDSSNLNKMEIEEEGLKLKLTKQGDITAVQQYSAASPAAAVQNQGGQAVSKEEPAPENKEESKPESSSSNLYEVKSPMVGTFYRAPSPDADPFVNVGDSISSGKVLCIVEAMKLMNEIEAEVSGKIVKILVEDAQAVEYNQPLFLVEPN